MASWEISLGLCYRPRRTRRPRPQRLEVCEGTLCVGLRRTGPLCIFTIQNTHEHVGNVRDDIVWRVFREFHRLQSQRASTAQELKIGQRPCDTSKALAVRVLV